MQSQSLWEHTLTFFPQFAKALAEQSPSAVVAVVGASDGKFVLPLAAAGHQVIAIERDPVALNGGDIELADGTTAHSLGLITRLKNERLRERVVVVESDFLEGDYLNASCDAVWTSCSWHYSANHRRPLSDFIGHMQHLIREGGLFGAEFMMPVTERHRSIEHYTSPEQLARYFGAPWQTLLALRTSEFTERPHIGRPYDHQHRMGLLLSVLPAPTTD